MVSEFSILALIALCVAAAVFVRRQSRLGRQLVFLFGTFVICPLFGFAMYQSMSQHVVDGFCSSNKFISFQIGTIVLGTAIAFAIWLVSFWISSGVGWVGRRYENAKWNIFNTNAWREPGWEENQFKKVPDGWVMRGVWPLNRANYLLSDKQKADVAAYLRSLGRSRASYVLAFFVIGGSMLLSSAPPPLNDPQWGQLIYFAGVFLCLLIWFTFDYRRRLAPVLSGAPRTTQLHYSYVDRFKMNVMSMSFAYLIVFGLLSFGFLIDGIYSVSISSDGGGTFIGNLLQIAAFGFGTLMFILIAAMKLIAGRPKS